MVCADPLGRRPAERLCGPELAQFRQALALGGHVRKGESGTMVVFADRRFLNQRRTSHVHGGDGGFEYANAAPFKRNDQLLDILPIGVIVFPGSGISANFADKARKLGIPVWKFGDRGVFDKLKKALAARRRDGAPVAFQVACRGLLAARC